VGVIVEELATSLGAMSRLVLERRGEVTPLTVTFMEAWFEEAEGTGGRLLIDSEAGTLPVFDETTGVGEIDVPEEMNVETPVDAGGGTSDVAETVEEADGVHVSVTLT